MNTKNKLTLLLFGLAIIATVTVINKPEDIKPVTKIEPIQNINDSKKTIDQSPPTPPIKTEDQVFEIIDKIIETPDIEKVEKVEEIQDLVFRFENDVIHEDVAEKMREFFSNDSFPKSNFEITGVRLTENLDIFFNSIKKGQNVSGNAIDHYGNEILFEECESKEITISQSVPPSDKEKPSSKLEIKRIKCENDLFKINISIKKTPNLNDFKYDLNYVIDDKDLVDLNGGERELTTQIGGDFYDFKNYGVVIKAMEMPILN